MNDMPTDTNIELSLEQQFNIRSFNVTVAQMSREQAQEFLIKLYEQMTVRENMYRHLMKQSWGLAPITSGIVPELD